MTDIQIPTAEPEARTIPYSDASFGRGMHVTVNDNTFAGAAARQVTVGGLNPNRVGILATAISPSTGAVPQKLSPTDLVMIGGLQVPLRAAEQQGYIRRDATTGEYAEIPAAERAAKAEAAQVAQKAAADAQRVTLDPMTERGLGQMIDAIQAGGGNPAQDLALMLTNGTISPTLEAAASKLGATSEAEFRATVQTINEAFAAQITEKVVKPAGVNAAEFQDWLDAKGAHVGRSAMLQVWLGHGLAAYGSLVEKFVAERGPGRGGPLPEGARQNDKGETLVPYPMPSGRTGWTSPAVARSLGLIR